MDGMSGVAYHRLYVPHYRMAVNGEIEVFINQYLNEWDNINFSNVDAVVFNRWLGPKQEDILTELAKKKIPYIVDIDDYWKLHGGHMAKKLYSKVMSKSIKQAIAYADGIITTTPILKDSIRALNKNAPITLASNCIDTDNVQWNHKKIESNVVRIGWVGGISHLTDIALISGVFDKLSQTHEFELYVCGYSDDTYEVAREWSQIIDYFASGNRPSWLKIMQGVNPNEYGIFYSQFDVAIAPLQNTKFNNNKSPLKIAEAGAYGLPILVSAVDPYCLHWDNEGMIMVRNTFEDWVDKLSLIIDNKRLRKVMGEINSDYCENVFDLNTENKNRLKLYEQCISSIRDQN